MHSELNRNKSMSGIKNKSANTEPYKLQREIGEVKDRSKDTHKGERKEYKVQERKKKKSSGNMLERQTGLHGVITDVPQDTAGCSGDGVH